MNLTETKSITGQKKKYFIFQSTIICVCWRGWLQESALEVTNPAFHNVSDWRHFNSTQNLTYNPNLCVSNFGVIFGICHIWATPQSMSDLVPSTVTSELRFLNLSSLETLLKKKQTNWRPIEEDTEEENGKWKKKWFFVTTPKWKENFANEDKISC